MLILLIPRKKADARFPDMILIWEITIEPLISFFIADAQIEFRDYVSALRQAEISASVGNGNDDRV